MGSHLQVLVLLGLMALMSLSLWKTKTEVELELDKKVNKIDVELELAKTANQDYVKLELDKKANKIDVGLELDKKANKIDVAAAVAKKADRSYVENGLPNVENELEKKADKEQCNPPGVIVMWSGSSASVPPGWALCDGSNGTPNLVGRFILAAGEGDEHKKGGQWVTRIGIEQLPPHRHNGYTDTDLHSHHYDRVPKGSMAWKRGGRDPFWDGEYNPQYQRTETTGYSHRHRFETEAAGGGRPISLAPPYYALAFIMKL